jgi:hypothetical protein
VLTHQHIDNFACPLCAMHGMTSSVSVRRYDCKRHYIRRSFGPRDPVCYAGDYVDACYTCSNGHYGTIEGNVKLPALMPKPHTVLWLYRDEVDA